MTRYSTSDSASAANTSRMECCLTNTVAAQIVAATMTDGMRAFLRYCRQTSQPARPYSRRRACSAERSSGIGRIDRVDQPAAERARIHIRRTQQLAVRPDHADCQRDGKARDDERRIANKRTAIVLEQRHNDRKIKNGYQSTYARMNPGKNGILSSSGRYEQEHPPSRAPCARPEQTRSDKWANTAPAAHICVLKYFFTKLSPYI